MWLGFRLTFPVENGHVPSHPVLGCDKWYQSQVHRSHLYKPSRSRVLRIDTETSVLIFERLWKLLGKSPFVLSFLIVHPWSDLILIASLCSLSYSGDSCLVLHGCSEVSSRGSCVRSGFETEVMDLCKGCVVRLGMCCDSK